MSGGVKRKPDTGGGPVDDRWNIRIDKKKCKKDKSGV